MRASASLRLIALGTLLQLPLSLADIEITSPKSGTSWTGAQTVTIEWKDNGEDPPLTDFSSYNVMLCAGSNAAPACEQTLATNGKFSAATTSAKVQIPAAAGADGKNVYFIQFEAIATKGGSTINYSDRFSLSGMTGQFSAAAIAGQKVGDKTKPKSVNTVAEVADAGDAADEMSVTYTMQTGATRYAPMQTQPGSTITKKSAKPQYPTSSYSAFKSGNGVTPNVQTTITAAWTYSVTSLENTASAAPMPQENAMQKFLNRWKD